MYHDYVFDVPESIGPEFEAKYESDCSECFGPIELGDLIRADGRGLYAHSECLETEER